MIGLSRTMHYLSTCSLLVLINLLFSTASDHLRGVSLTRSKFYDPTKDFSCFDGSSVLPFRFVNDDYCDCIDGSDEPGTSACQNGIFHCTNAGHRPMNIPSSRVNDGICDCCDGSEEYHGLVQCVNNCKELGKKAREEEEKLAEALNKGFEIRQQLSLEGKRLQEERRVKIAELEQQKSEAESERLTKEATKVSVEDQEKAALEVYKQEDEARMQEENARKEQERKEEALKAFEEMDINQDQRVSAEEIRNQWQLDPNKDGQFTDEEMKMYLGEKMDTGIDSTEFLEHAWMLMKPHYNLKNMFKSPEDLKEHAEESSTSTVAPIVPELQLDTETEPIEQGGDNPLEEESERYDDEDEEEDDESYDPEPPRFDGESSSFTTASPETATETVTTPQYDEETQRLIDAANQARQEFNEADKKYKNIENELSETQKLVDMDFGPDDEFAPLKEQCFEYTDREYIYKMCSFDNTSQRPKAGGSEISLGKWEDWIGEGDSKHSKMKYSNGQGCWNGPNRNTEVRLSCGIDNQITMVTEPNRCEYVFDFTTPAACRTRPHLDHAHEEL